MRRWLAVSVSLTLLGCAAGEDPDALGGNRLDADLDGRNPDDDSALSDSISGDSTSGEGAVDSAATTIDSAALTDTGAASGDSTTTADTSATKDTGPAVGDTSGGGPITGGPCISGSAGATAFRVRWVNSGGKATVSYEVTGLPDKSGFKVGSYDMSFTYTPMYVDIPLSGEGGLQLDSGTFIDIDLSTVGLSSIKTAKLSLYGRSYATSSSGSFTWLTGSGSGSSSTISNAPPYHWDGTDVTIGLPVGKLHKLRIKPGPPSGSLVVNRIELCVQAT